MSEIIKPNESYLRNPTRYESFAEIEKGKARYKKGIQMLKEAPNCWLSLKCGVPLPILMVGDEVVINPKITWEKKLVQKVMEGSAYGLENVYCIVERLETIKISYITLVGNKLSNEERRFNGVPSFAIQQAIDIFHGVTILDRAVYAPEYLDTKDEGFIAKHIFRVKMTEKPKNFLGYDYVLEDDNKGLFSGLIIPTQPGELPIAVKLEKKEEENGTGLTIIK